jgi:hypothetical protein
VGAATMARRRSGDADLIEIAFAVSVDDLDSECRDLAELGVLMLKRPADRRGPAVGVRTARGSDPRTISGDFSGDLALDV